MRLERIRSDIKECGKSVLCPNWIEYMQPETVKQISRADGGDCLGRPVCYAIFPNIPEHGRSMWDCPCTIYPEAELLRTIDTVLKGDVEI